VATRTRRPSSTATPSLLSTIGMIPARHAILRKVSTGRSRPSMPVSMIEWSCNPTRNVCSSTTMMNSGRPDSPFPSVNAISANARR
jgi:hypothetical protein